MALWMRPVVLLFATAAGVFGSSFDQDLICADYARHISAYNPTHIYNPPNPRGDWASMRCETVPGPQYIIRHFSIQFNAWTGRFHHYEDGACTKPRFTVTVSGRFAVNSTLLHLSKSTYGCYLGFDKIGLVVHDENVAYEAEDLVNKRCPGSVKVANSNSWLLGHQARDRKRCREYFGLHPYSYSRLMMIGQKRTNHLQDLLYFGDLPPTTLRKNFQPRGFQLELVRSDRPDCEVCLVIKKSLARVPILPGPTSRRDFGDFAGAWVTETCKSYQDAHDTGGMSFFRTNLLKFFPGNDMHVGQFISQDYYFSDVNCYTLNFVLRGGGHFKNISRSLVVDSAVDLSFDVQWMLMAVYEPFTLAALKTSEGDCGKASSWREGVEQNITGTGGCAYFGISVPFTIPSLLRVVKGNKGFVELHLSEPDNQGSLSSERPTHLSKTLKSCTEIAVNRTLIFEPLTTELPHAMTFPTVDIVSPDFVSEDDSRKNSDSYTTRPLRCFVVFLVIHFWLNAL